MATLLWQNFLLMIRCCLMASLVTSPAGGWLTMRTKLQILTNFWTKILLLPFYFHCFSTVWGNTAHVLQVAPVSVVEHPICSQPEWGGQYGSEKYGLCRRQRSRSWMSGTFNYSIFFCYIETLNVTYLILTPLGWLWRSPELFHRRGSESLRCCQLQSGWDVQPEKP